MTVEPYLAFMAILPKQTQIGDEIILKGKIKDNAQAFSVNFVLSCCPNPNNIAYHLKMDFVGNRVTQNYKTIGIWNEERVNENTWIRSGQEFVLTFHFDDSEILVYSGDENRCYLYKFDYKFDIGDIMSVQLWDDVDCVNEIIFRYRQ